MKRFPEHGFLSTNDLFKNESEIISYLDKSAIKKEKSITKNPVQEVGKRGIFSQRLKDIFGFFKSIFYIEYDSENKIMHLYLISDKPFSFTEIRIICERLDVAYGDRVKKFKIYQEPDSDIDSNKWLSFRKDLEDSGDENHHNFGINRTIGFIYETKSSHYGKKYQLNDSEKSNKNHKNTIIDVLLLYIWNQLKMTHQDYHKISDYQILSAKFIESNVLKIILMCNDFRLQENLNDDVFRYNVIKKWNEFVKSNIKSDNRYAHLQDLKLITITKMQLLRLKKESENEK